MNATFSRARAGQPRVVCEPSVFEKLLPPLAFPRSSLRARVSTTASSPHGAEAASLARAHDERDRGRRGAQPAGRRRDLPRRRPGVAHADDTRVPVRQGASDRARAIDRSSSLFLAADSRIDRRRDPAAAPSLPRERIESASARRPTSRPSSRARSHLPPPPPPPRARRDGSARSASVAAARAIATSSSASNQSASSSSSATA